MPEFHGRSAVVVGGARGIGAAIAQTLVKSGLRVVVADLLDTKGAATAESLGPTAMFQHLQISPMPWRPRHHRGPMRYRSTPLCRWITQRPRQYVPGSGSSRTQLGKFVTPTGAHHRYVMPDHSVV
ncbi:SDR family NAD(P)-dependent oxidoreductase [Nocardia sp. CA-135953]|uniref:SDR family NAD(P)-dependent oxidoreductase n=1 Tax=Nocardia sp. CA-135953 TaxID=3239978 RepID=UPI003D9684E0